MSKPGPQLKGRALQLVDNFRKKVVACGLHLDWKNHAAVELASREATEAHQALARYILGLQKKLKADRRPPKKGATPLSAVTLRLMRSLDEETRLSIMREFCLGCGSINPNCYCQNDE